MAKNLTCTFGQLGKVHHHFISLVGIPISLSRSVSEGKEGERIGEINELCLSKSFKLVDDTGRSEF